MKLRQALIEQGPSLALQRAAQAEIALMDKVIEAATLLLEYDGSTIRRDLLEEALIKFNMRTAE